MLCQVYAESLILRQMMFRTVLTWAPAGRNAATVLLNRAFVSLLLLVFLPANRPLAQTVTIDTSAAGRRQIIDGFGTCLSGNEGTNAWWQQLYFDDLGASMLRVDLSPNFRSPYSDNAYNSPTWGNAGPDGNYARDYTNALDYKRQYSGRSAPIAVMGPNIETNIGYFVFPATPGAVARAGAMRRLQLGDFKLFGSLWSPAPWVKLSSGNTYGGSSYGLPANGTPWPFIWLGNYAGGKLDVYGTPLNDFDDSSLGGAGPTSALTQFARCTAAYVRGFQRAYLVQFYALSIQNELNFEEFYNSCTYPLSSQYIAALKAVRAEFDKYPDLAPIKLMGPEDLMGGDAYGMWQYGAGSTAIHKNLQYLQNIAADPVAAAALSFFCIHGYASDGVTATGSTPTQWNWWLNGWTSGPAAGIPANVVGTASYSKKSWMTETSGEAAGWLSPSTGFPNQGAWSIALKIHQALVAGGQSAWAYWQFTDGNPISASTLTDATQRANAAKYVAAKHFFRFIRPNAVRVNASVSNATSLSASAFLSASNSALTIVLVNSDTNAATVQIQAPPVPAGLTSFQAFTSGSGALWVSNSVAIAGGSATVVVPAYGICTLYGQSVATPVPPAITSLPQSTNVIAGANVQLSCVATGDAALSFQWFFNNLPIPGAIGTMLVLTNVQPFQAGQYAVQVTNAAGSITSFPAILGVSGSATLPLITLQLIITRPGSVLLLSFLSNAGRIYSWQISTNLNSWLVTRSFVSASSVEQWAVLDLPGSPVQYFRVSSP
jgi:O-glycosyl hydrolase